MDIYLGIIGFLALISLMGFFWLVITGFRRNAFWGILIFLFWPLTAPIFSVLNWFDAKRPFLVFIPSVILMFGTMAYVVNEIGTNNLMEISQRIQAKELKPYEALTLMDKALMSPGDVNLFEEEQPELGSGIEAGGESPESSTTKMVEGEKGEESQTSGKANDVVADEKKTTEDKKSDKPQMDAKDKPEEVMVKEDGKIDPDEAIDKIPSPGFPKLSEVRPDPLLAKRKKQNTDFIIVKFGNAKKYKDRYFVIYTKKQTFLRGLLVKADKNALYLNRKLFGGSFEYRLTKKKIKTIYMLKKEFVVERDRNRLPGF